MTPWPWTDLADHVGRVPPEVVDLVATAERAVVAAGAQRVAEHPWGLLLASQFTPDVWDANQALVTTSDADVDEVLDVLDAAAAHDGLAHRRLRIDHPGLIDAADAAARRRWPRVGVATRALMVAAAAPDRQVDTSPARPVLAHELAPLLAAARAEQDGVTPRVVHQHATRDKRLLAALGDAATLGIVVDGADGTPVAGVQVLLVGPVAHLGAWHVVAPHRGTGLGRIALQAAMQLAADAGARTVQVVCDPEDWTWRLLARLGFSTARLATVLTRPGPFVMDGDVQERRR